MLKPNFTKISLPKIKPGSTVENTLTGIELELSEEQHSENGDFIRAIEKRVKIKGQYAHDDLLRLFDKMRPHLALVCEINTGLPDDQSGDEAELVPDVVAPGIAVRSVLIGGSDEQPRITIIGCKQLIMDKELELKTPPIRLGNGEYFYEAQLAELVSQIETEARLALYEHKGKGVQGRLFDDEEPAASPAPAKRTKAKSLAEALMGGLSDGISITIKESAK